MLSYHFLVKNKAKKKKKRNKKNIYLRRVLSSGRHPKKGNSEKKKKKKKMEIQFFSAENNNMSTSFGKKLVTLGDYENVKTHGQCMSLMGKTEFLFFSFFFFFNSPIFPFCLSSAAKWWEFEFVSSFAC